MKRFLLLGILIVPLTLATVLTATKSAASSAASFEQIKEKKVKEMSQRLTCIKDAKDKVALKNCSKQSKKHKAKAHEKKTRAEEAPQETQPPAQSQ